MIIKVIGYLAVVADFDTDDRDEAATKFQEVLQTLPLPPNFAYNAVEIDEVEGGS